MAATTTVAPKSTATTAAAVSHHLGQPRVNLLLGLLQNRHEITGLFRICKERRRACVSDVFAVRKQQGRVGNSLLSVVKRVIAVPFAPARPVRPIRWM